VKGTGAAESQPQTFASKDFMLLRSCQRNRMPPSHGFIADAGSLKTDGGGTLDG